MEVETQEQFEQVLQIASNMQRDVWLGGNDIEEEGVWVWDVNNQRIDMNQFWGTRQPSRNGDPDSDVDCLLFQWDDLFDDKSCSRARSYLCKLNSNTTL